MSPSKTDQVLRLAGELGIITADDLEEHRLPRRYLSRLCERGELKRVDRGLYTLPDAEITEHHDLAIVSKRVPRGVLCLLSALRFYDLTTQAPFEVWLAIAPEDWEPRPGTVPLRTVRMSAATLTEGVVEHNVEGVPVRVFVPAKTVADCFRFRNMVGLDVALEALREFRRARAGSMDELWHFAGTLRVQNVIRPYLEAVV
jgi:predicted transcriptional regulator of viral defense system